MAEEDETPKSSSISAYDSDPSYKPPSAPPEYNIGELSITHELGNQLKLETEATQLVNENMFFEHDLLNREKKKTNKIFYIFYYFPPCFLFF